MEKWTGFASGLFLTAALSLLAAGCLSNSPDDSSPPAAPVSIPETAASPTVEPTPTPARDAQTGDLIPRQEFGLPFRMARGNLSSRLGVSPFTIHLAEIERVEWPDASLSNRQPEGIYSEKSVPGFRMVLESEGNDETYVYHTSMTRAVFVDEEDEEDSG